MSDHKICTKCKEIKSLNEFQIRSRIKGTLQSHCKSCRNSHSKNQYKNNLSYKENIINANLIKIKTFHDYIWNVLSNTNCEICNEANPLVLEFDHIDPKNKSRNIAEMKYANLDEVKKEILKCRILCANCHRIGTQNQFNTWRNCYTNNIKIKIDKNLSRNEKNKQNSKFRAREYIWNILNNSKCNTCENKDPRVLEFDHIKFDKEYNISAMFLLSIETIQQEIEKCNILCANCHRIKTIKEKNQWKNKYLI